MLHASAHAFRGRSLRVFLGRDITIPYLPTMAALAAVVVLGTAASFRTLLPLAQGESPEALLIAVPFVALALLASRLANLSRHGHEVGINAVFCAPLLFVYIALLLWLPPRFSVVYWYYRFDLLALPTIVAVGVLLLFGLPALLRCWAPMLLFLLGWPPVFDRLVSLVADPIAQLDATLVGVLAAPLAPHAQRVGQTFLLGRDSSSAIGISSACAGLAALFSMALVGAFLPRNVTGSRRAKLLWFGCALALVFAANLARLTAVVVVAERAGLGAGFRVFHASAGILLFSVSLLIMLRLLRLFRLRLTVPRLRSAPRLRFKARGLVLVASLLLSLSMLGVWTESGFGFLGPGSFAQTPTVASDNMLPAPPGMQRALVDRLPFIEVLFGHGARSYEYDFNVSGRTGIGAQIVVVPTLSQIRSYGALDCFVFHRYKIYAGHLVQLRNGGTAMLAAMRIAGQDVATISWYQPVRLDGEHAWRRVILFQYLTGQPVHSDFKPSLSRRVGYWLLNTLAPLGSTHPPQRFLATERELRAYANAMSIRSSA